MVELPSNIFCQFANCNSKFIVHHRASDILEACNNPQRRGKRSSEASKTLVSSNDHDNSSEDLLSLDDIHCHSSGEFSNTSCCGISNGNKHKFIGNQRASKYNHNKRIMMEPVILPCNHGYCQECITHMTDMVCHVCARAFTFRDTKVNKYLQQICDWFGENRTFISLLLGQDITQPVPLHPRLSRSVSSDISRPRTFSTSPPTRSNSSDSIGSMKDGEDQV
jgi:hypothetical protein